MSIFDDEESIVLRKAIERDREWQKKTSNNPFDYSRISNNAQAMLEYSDDQRNRKVIDATMSFGPAAIQKIGNGQVFGKFAKAVRKYLTGKRKFADTSDITGIVRISNGKETIQSVIKDMNIKTKYPYDNAMKFSQLKAGSHGYTTSSPGMQYSKNYNHVQDVVVRNDISPYNSTMHELGHVVDYSKDISSRLNIGNKGNGWNEFLYHEKPSEIFAEAFSQSKGFPITNVKLGESAKELLKNSGFKSIMDSYKVNIYPK